MPRLFVAVWPTEPIRQHLRDLPRDGWSGVRWMPEENWHVTLAFLGDAEIDGVVAALTRQALPRATAEIGSRMSVMGKSSLVVPVSGVDELAATVRAATGGARADQPFRGHLTIGRSIGRQRIDGPSARSDSAAPVRLEVIEIALVASTTSAAGATYVTVDTFPTTVTDPSGGH